jgi:hypothetical protein
MGRPLNLSFIGPRGEAEAVKRQRGECLDRELKRELCAEKPLITPAKTEAARFLGDEITTHQNDEKQAKSQGDRHCVNGDRGLRVPQEVIRQKRQRYQQAANRSTGRSEPTRASIPSWRATHRNIGASSNTTGWPRTDARSADGSG